MMQIGRADLLAARQALNQVSVKGIENCKMLLYAYQLLGSAAPVNEDNEDSREEVK